MKISFGGRNFLTLPLEKRVENIAQTRSTSVIAMRSTMLLFVLEIDGRSTAGLVCYNGCGT